MNIKQVATHLERLAQPFDVIIKKEGKEKTLYANLEPNDVKTLLYEVTETHKPDKLIIQERKRNGSVNKKMDNYPVDLQESSNLYGLGTTTTPMPIKNQNLSYNVPTDYKDYLIKDLERKVDKYEHKIEKLEADNEKLKRDNFDLEKDVKFKDKEFEIATRSKELEQSNGLNGILETVSTNPALANIATMAIGRLMGVEMPTPQQGIEEPETNTEETTETAENTLQLQVANHLKTWLLKQSKETAEKFYKVANILSKDVSQIDKLLKLFANGTNQTV